MIRAIVFLASGMVLFLAGFPLWRGRVPPNSTYGFRTSATMSNERIWYTVNKVAGLEIMFIGLCVVVAAIAFHVSGVGPRISSAAMSMIVIVPLLGVLIHGLILSRKMMR